GAAHIKLSHLPQYVVLGGRTIGCVISSLRAAIDCLNLLIDGLNLYLACALPLCTGSLLPQSVSFPCLVLVQIRFRAKLPKGIGIKQFLLRLFLGKMWHWRISRQSPRYAKQKRGLRVTSSLVLHWGRRWGWGFGRVRIGVLILFLVAEKLARCA